MEQALRRRQPGPTDERAAGLQLRHRLRPGPRPGGRRLRPRGEPRLQARGGPARGRARSCSPRPRPRPSPPRCAGASPPTARWPSPATPCRSSGCGRDDDKESPHAQSLRCRVRSPRLFWPSRSAAPAARAPRGAGSGGPPLRADGARRASPGPAPRGAEPPRVLPGRLDERAAGAGPRRLDAAPLARDRHPRPAAVVGRSGHRPPRLRRPGRARVAAVRPRVRGRGLPRRVALLARSREPTSTTAASSRAPRPTSRSGTRPRSASRAVSSSA